jgi:hypothetical protein
MERNQLEFYWGKKSAGVLLGKEISWSSIGERNQLEFCWGKKSARIRKNLIQ